MSAPGSGEQGAVLLVHYPRLTNGPILDDERWLPTNRRPPTHIALPLSAAAQQAREEALSNALVVILGFSPPPSEIAFLLAALGLSGDA